MEQICEKNAPLLAESRLPLDAVLIARLRGGDLQAFETVVRRYGGGLLATARRMLGNDHDAQDAVQEAFSAAFNSFANFRGDARISTWLHRILVNAALMQLRRRRRWSEVAIDELFLPCNVDGCRSAQSAPSSRASEHWIEVRETREAIRRCIDQLPAIYRSALVLRDIEELSTCEAAAMLGIKANTVKIRLHRARQALTILLDREGLLRGSLSHPRRPR